MVPQLWLAALPVAWMLRHLFASERWARFRILFSFSLHSFLFRFNFGDEKDEDVQTFCRFLQKTWHKKVAGSALPGAKVLQGCEIKARIFKRLRRELGFLKICFQFSQCWLRCGLNSDDRLAWLQYVNFMLTLFPERFDTFLESQSWETQKNRRATALCQTPGKALL